MANSKIYKISRLSAIDRDWNDEKFPSLEEIYRKDNIIQFDQKTKNRVLKPLTTLIDDIIKDEKFQEYVFDENVLNIRSKPFSKIISLMKQCSVELLDKMLLKVLGGVVDREVLNDLAASCLSLSIKLYGAHDWIYSAEVINTIVDKARTLEIILDPKLINIMERDIMKNTDWKGCPTFYLDKTYDKMFKDEDEDELLSAIKRKVEDVEDVELTNGAFERIEPGGFYLKYKNSYYNIDSVDSIPIVEIKHVVVKEEFVELVAKVKNLTKQEAFNWLRDRVLKAGFEITPLSFEYKSYSYRMAKRHSTKSPHSRRSNSKRKYRKASRRLNRSKSKRKSKRKSRKASRRSLRSKRVM